MKKILKGVPGAYILLILFILYLPLFVVIGFSFNTQPKGLMWTGFTLEWYPKLFESGQIMRAFQNSLLVGFWSCAISCVIGTLSAVALSRVKLKSAGIVESVATLPVMMPEIVLGLAFMLTFSMLKLPFGMPALILSHATFCIPYILIIVRTRLQGLNPAYEEAARDLGAGPLRAFFTVVLPLIAPAILSGTLLAFAMSMDDVIISFFMSSPTTTTFPVYVFGKLKTSVPPTINAMATVTLGVTFIAVAASQWIRGRGQQS